MTAAETRSLAASIRRRQAEGVMPVISEIKVRSPKEGDLLRGRAPEDLAAAMATTPIAGLSVVTDLIHFGGDTDIIRAIRPLVPVPILRKDFTHSERDLDETVDAGADAILLTVCLLDDEPLARLHAAAHERGLETLVEVHDDKEIGRVVDLGLRPDVLGVNNRDIQIGETDDGDVTRTERLLPTLPAGSVLLSESAIAGPDDARRARAAGADAVLVGTAVLRAPDPAEAIRALVEVGWPERPA
ncbi:MAG TPA: indole-3-glycerol-phosphate synthase [Acidimicrobiia bacterium]|nr:indole-3-glycerol-phosphate synthase [Acidimicrobiia bacterium]